MTVPASPAPQGAGPLDAAAPEPATPGTAATPGASAPSAGGAFANRVFAMVTDNRSLGSLVWLTVFVPGWSGARPGQFAMVQAPDSTCFLGRPLSIAQQDGESVSFLIAPVGAGTRGLCSLAVGDPVWILGPLGNGFDLDLLTGGATGRLLVAGGGVGAAPFPLLLSALATRAAAARAAAGEAPALEVVVLLGFRDAAQAAGAAPVAEAAAGVEEQGIVCPGEVVTEDGSIGRSERITDALWRHIRPGDRLAVCGPWAMTEAVAKVCASVPGVDAWYSLEAGMACGVGSCHGCVVPLAGGGNARVCREGPVFPAQALFERGRLSASGEGQA